MERKRENIVLKLEVSLRLPKSQKANICIKSRLTLTTLWRYSPPDSFVHYILNLYKHK